MNSIENTSRHGVALGLASLLVAGGTLIPSAAVADQYGDGGSIAIYANTGLDIDQHVDLRQNAMYRAWAQS